MNRQHSAKHKIKKAILAIDEAISEKPADIFSVTTQSQLEQLRSGLSKALASILKNKIPEKEYRELGATRVIVDQWPYTLPLGLIIIEAEDAYKNI